jgi:aminoglycoside phosphotransferase (APT) family kinase protein
VSEVRRRPSPYQTSFGLEEVEVILDDSERLGLLLKDLAWSALDAAGRMAKPDFLYDPLREIEVYRRLLAGADLGAPRYYGSVVDPERDRFWLFVEKVEGRELYQVGELEQWALAARWLAVMHARFADDVERHVAEARLVRHDAAYYRSWIGRAREYAAPKRRPALDRLATRYEGVVERLASLPPTVIHGEFYASNVLVADGGRVAPVDWEVAGAGPGLVDLAALATGWGSGERAALARAYGEAASASGAPGVEGQGRGEALELCRLHLAVQRLGWAPPGWSPPKEHRRDWLAEALQIAEELGL